MTQLGRLNPDPVESSGETAAATTVDDVLAAESERLRAIRENDWPALDRVLADELIYIHTSGASESKTEHTAKLKANPRTYRRGELTVRTFADSAVMTGSVEVQLLANPDAAPNSNVALQVWILRDGCWQMAAYHG